MSIVHRDKRRHSMQYVCLDLISLSYEFLLHGFPAGSLIPSSIDKLYTDYELQGVIEEKLDSKTYQTVSQRMQTEEATCSLMQGCRRDEQERQDSMDGDDSDVRRVGATSHMSEDENVAAKVASATSNVVGKVGGVLGGFSKGLGGLGSKLGGGGFF